MRKLNYYVATSADGFIAREDGSFEDFALEGDHVTDFLADIESFGSVIMGRHTYEVGTKVGVTSPYPMLEQWVVSRTMKTADGAVKIADDAVQLATELRARDGKDVWLCGGGQVAGELLRAGLVDELVVKLNPFVLGSGIPLARGIVRDRLELLDTKVYDSQVVRLRYRCRGPADVS